MKAAELKTRVEKEARPEGGSRGPGKTVDYRARADRSSRSWTSRFLPLPPTTTNQSCSPTDVMNYPRDGFGWHLELLDNFFNDRDKMAIIGIPLQQNLGASSLDWFHDTGLLPGEGAERWCVLNLQIMMNELKVNVDTSIFRESQGFGFGLVARNEHGFMLGGVIKLHHGVVKPELAEAIGVREALSWIK
uniref:RNase H type-1 domain-containing protein n=1 Tax=Cannabis sativa TaxID=3483 RepID=A0A803Q1D8_CANSA